MNIADTRRKNLDRWVAVNGVPQKERSLFSQLKGGGSFGEKVARRLEVTYKMGDKFLDAPCDGDGGNQKTPSIEAPAQEERKDSPQYAWINSREAELITLYRTTDDRGRNEIMQEARSTARVIAPLISVDKT